MPKTQAHYISSLLMYLVGSQRSLIAIMSWRVYTGDLDVPHICHLAAT